MANREPSSTSPVAIAADAAGTPPQASKNKAARLIGLPAHSAPWDDPIVQDMSLLMLRVQIDVRQIATKAAHLIQARRHPRDCLRNAEILEDYATRLQTHSRQIIRRALEEQP